MSKSFDRVFSNLTASFRLEETLRCDIFRFKNKFAYSLDNGQVNNQNKYFRYFYSFHISCMRSLAFGKKGYFEEEKCYSKRNKDTQRCKNVCAHFRFGILQSLLI